MSPKRLTLVRIAGIVIAAAGLGMAGCASAPAGDRVGMAGLPLAAAHSDITFMLANGARQHAACFETPACGTRAMRLPWP